MGKNNQEKENKQDIKGTKIADSVFIFGLKNDKWICSNKNEAVENYKLQLKNKTKSQDLSILELRQKDDSSWEISEIPLSEIINDLY